MDRRIIGCLGCLLGSVASAPAGLHPASVTPLSVPWPGGIIPYQIDPSLSVARQQTYLDGLREWELAANVHFIPRTTEAQYVFFKYSPSGPNLVSGSNPQIVEINQLTRGQICHEMGHSLGLEHEHQRPDRGGFVTVLDGNITPGFTSPFDILPGSVSFGNYDFESVMHYRRDVYANGPGLDTIQTNAGFEKYQVRLSNATLSPVDRAHLASLYGPPAVLLSSVVTTTADVGPGSMRAAIYYAQDHPGSTVTFNIPTTDPGYANGVFTIRPTGSLPTLATDGLAIDATTQPGYAGLPVVFLNGSDLLPEAGELPGFLFYDSNCTVKGLGIRSYPWAGVAMLYGDATGNRVLGCSLGIDFTGNVAAPNAYYGAYLADGAHGNFIGGTGANERNFISGNALYGVWISGPTTTDNSVLGNFIGTNVSGNAAITNRFGGVILIDGAHHNTIGGSSAAARNVISGNTPLPPAFNSAGIWITGTGTDSNTVTGNFIGTNATGTAAVPNQSAGIYIVAGAKNNLVSCNVLSGNTSEGLRLADSGTTGNLVYENLAGTNAAGTAAIPNGFTGLAVLNGATGNHLGGGPGTGNLISGNATVGVLVADSGTSGNFIANNRIGPDAAGGNSLAQFSGIWLTNGSQSTLIGGTAPGAANVIAGNSGPGIAFYDVPTAAQSIRRNSIHGNGWQGIQLNQDLNDSHPAPELSTASLSIGTTVTGTLNGVANTQFTLEFFSSPDAKTFVGETSVTTDGVGAATFSVSLPATVPVDREIVATATSLATGGTSEFSNSVVVTSDDQDHDGLPDAYESSTPGLSSSNPLDAALDNDGDGFTNLQEFVAGTNPNDPTSRLLATGALASGNFQLSIATIAGKSYRIQRANDLSGSWETVAIHIAGTGGVVLVSMPVSNSGTRGFFRVNLEN